MMQLNEAVAGTGSGIAGAMCGAAASSLYPEMRFSWEIKSVDALFCNGMYLVFYRSSQGIEIRYSAHSSFTLTSLLIFKNLSKLVLLRDEMPCR